MPGLSIQRLSLHLAGLSQESGNELVNLIAKGLAAAQTTGCADSVDGMQLRVTLVPGVGIQELSDQIVAELLRQLRRSL